MKCRNCKIKFTQKHIGTPYCLENEECIKAFVIFARGKQIKKWNKEKKAKLPELYPKKYKGFLQGEINKLARKIDAKLGFDTCIDCNKTLINIPQTDAAHFHNSKNHGNIRYNLHNLHSAASDCNFYSDTHKQGYEIGLQERYSRTYFEYVKGLDLTYKDIKLTNKDIAEKLVIVRKLNREFESYGITGGIQARDLFNNLIGIYLGAE